MSLERSETTHHVSHKFAMAFPKDVPFGKERSLDLDRGALNTLIGGWKQPGYPIELRLGSGGYGFSQA